LRSDVVWDVREYLVLRRAVGIVESIFFDYFNVIDRTKTLAQTANELRIFFDRDNVSSDVCKRRGDYPVSGSDLAHRVGWSNRTHPNQAADQLRTPQEVLRQRNLTVLPCFHVSPPENVW